MTFVDIYSWLKLGSMSHNGLKKIWVVSSITVEMMYIDVLDIFWVDERTSR